MNFNNQKIIKLRKEGFSFREICKKLKSSYGTVYRICSNIKMSKKGLERYSKLNGLTRDILFKDELNKNKVRIISNLLFDGAVYKDKEYHYSIMYVNSSKELISQFIEDAEKVYNVKPSTFEKHDRYKRVKYLSKHIYDDLIKYLKSYSTSDEICEIPSIILKNNNSFKQILLQAFWENEGAITYQGSLVVTLKSKKVINQLSKIHDKFGIKHRVRIQKVKGYGLTYRIYILMSKENYKKFISLKLFSKAIVTKGHNKGRKKISVLKEYYNNKYLS